MQWQLITPQSWRPPRVAPVERRHSASTRAFEVRTRAELDIADIDRALQRRTNVVTKGCAYCRHPETYGRLPGGCVCSRQSESEYVNEMRAAAAANGGLSYSAPGYVLSVR